MEILVLGAGVIGLSTAYYLNAAAHQVTVVERNTEVGLETSHANGGQLSYSYVAPLAGPGVLTKIPNWLTRDDAPMRFRPSFNAEQWRWCLQFLRACNRRESDRSTRQLLALSFLSRSLMHRLVREETSLDFDYVRSGKLVLHRDANTYRAAVDQLEFQRTLGCEQQALDRHACIALEPALAPIGEEIAGGIHTSSEDSADCFRLCKGLETLLRARGVDFQLGTHVDGLRRSTRGRVQAYARGRPIAAEQIVVALGCASTPLLKSLDIRLPVYPLKGYSLTVPTNATSIAPTVSVTDFARKVVYARLGNSLRVAGMADLSGYSLDLDRNRLATLQRESVSLFPRAGDYAAAVQWAGLRPATPRGTPILGRTPFGNLWLNVGHGALGFTLATGSAQLLSDWISGRPGAIDREMFSLPA